ncbi:MAG: hypothetical protein IJW45_00645 [Oscillospiraceae bacterium]|nr:hypothetical protein [Oscillospiraceae bacterium]
MENWYLEIDFPTIVVFVSAIATLILQLLLCFKAKKISIKLLPIALLTVSTIVFSICSATINGWDGLGHLFFALLSFGLILVCGLGWGVWAIIRKRN